jgi:N-acetylglucosamine malate deacetylase 2
MQKKMLAVFAHPDDEAFGPGGTIAKYAHEGVEVHLLCATRGEAGQWDEESKNKQQTTNNKKQITNNKQQKKIHHVREEELLDSAKILGVKRVEFLNYVDGTLCNAVYHEIAEKIMKKIQTFKPQILLTVERRGVSGHLDHIAMSMITTYAFQKTTIPKKLYYHCLPQKWFDHRMQEYFIYFPEGYGEDEITTRIDYTKYWEEKKNAMIAHKSQAADSVVLLKRYSKWPKTDHFILQYHRNVNLAQPETDFFSGVED